LECATPAFAPARAAYLLYFNRVLPAIGRLVSGHRTAYTYLPTSVAEFPDPEEFTRRIERSGFDAVSWRSLTLGTASLHSATKR
jgi:demethylmenaquinone methyltransferase / 2-methoxy-6-polyprenyl-1,4-benzoquinol methylase